VLDHIVEIINDQSALAAIVERLNTASVIALDIETANWWDRESERVSLVQLAFRENGEMRVAVIDALAGFDPEMLRQPLELSLQTKAIHNASFDAVKLARHFSISTSPIHDTMLAARRSGERRCSLQAQVETHLGFQLDKSEQRGDWSRRPLSAEQLKYAALDAACTLLLTIFGGIPVSTTHTITGSIVGVGAARRPNAVRWGVASQVVWAWILTIPAAALISAASWWLLNWLS